MNTRKRKIKEIQYEPAFNINDEAMWRYKEYTQEDLEKMDKFFETYKKNLPTIMGQNLFKNYTNLCSKIGLHPHPVLVEQPMANNNEEIVFVDINQLPGYDDLQSAAQMQEDSERSPNKKLTKSNLKQQIIEKQFEEEKEDDFLLNYLILQNTRIDAAMLKLLHYV